jgi:predicted RNA-binding Zn-ribbon protein involved in translation (DUF1610 family)
MFESVIKPGKAKMLKHMHEMLDAADCVVHYNGTKFDIPTLNKEFLLAGLPPPAPYSEVDLLKTARRRFKFPSNKLDYISGVLGIGNKTDHEGFDLWIKCMNKNKDAWKRMEQYNKQDVLLLESLYKRFLPWIKAHPNHGVVHNSPHICPNCSSVALQRRGFTHTQSGAYQRYQCTTCGAWSQQRQSTKIGQGVLKSL